MSVLFILALIPENEPIHPCQDEQLYKHIAADKLSFGNVGGYQLHRQISAVTVFQYRRDDDDVRQYGRKRSVATVSS